PICDPAGSRYVVCPPCSIIATSNAQRVRVEVFSNSSATFLPVRRCRSAPSLRSCFRRAARSSSERHSSTEKSSSLVKLRPLRWVTGGLSEIGGPSLPRRPLSFAIGLPTGKTRRPPSQWACRPERLPSLELVQDSRHRRLDVGQRGVEAIGVAVPGVDQG